MTILGLVHFIGSYHVDHTLINTERTKLPYGSYDTSIAHHKNIYFLPQLAEVPDTVECAFSPSRSMNLFRLQIMQHD